MLHDGQALASQDNAGTDKVAKTARSDSYSLKHRHQTKATDAINLAMRVTIILT